MEKKEEIRVQLENAAKELCGRDIHVEDVVDPKKREEFYQSMVEMERGGYSYSWGYYRIAIAVGMVVAAEFLAAENGGLRKILEGVFEKAREYYGISAQQEGLAATFLKGYSVCAEDAQRALRKRATTR